MRVCVCVYKISHMCNLLVCHEWLWGMRANGVAWEPSYNNSRLASQHISSTTELCNKSEEKHQRKCICACVFRPCLHYLWYFCKNLSTAFAPVSHFELMFLERKTEQNTVLMKFFFFTMKKLAKYNKINITSRGVHL